MPVISHGASRDMLFSVTDASFIQPCNNRRVFQNQTLGCVIKVGHSPEAQEKITGL